MPSGEGKVLGKEEGRTILSKQAGNETPRLRESLFTEEA